MRERAEEAGQNEYRKRHIDRNIEQNQTEMRVEQIHAAHLQEDRHNAQNGGDEQAEHVERHNGIAEPQ